MDRRLIALFVLGAALSGCASTPEPAPTPPPPPEVRSTENQGALKAATWRAAAEAERLAGLRAAIGRAHRSPTVAGALRYALLTQQISPAAHARLARDYADARAATGRLTGARAAELGSVVATVDSLAAQHLL